MKKKSIISIVTAVCLAAVALVGATLAYFTDQTGEVVNTFTVGDVNIDLTEPDWDPDNGKDLYPGAEVAKNPMITNTGTGDGYIVMKVIGMDAMAAQGFSAVYDVANWDLVDADGNKRAVPEGNALVDGYYVYNKGALASGATTPALFDKVILSEDAQEIVGATYKIMGNFKDENGLFTYEDAAGNEIAANVDRQPTAFNADGTPKVTYTIDGVDGKTFKTAAEAQEFLLDEANGYKASASLVFDLTVQGYAIQTTDITFADYTSWVPVLVK